MAVSTYKEHGFEWIDVTQPSQEELADIGKKYGLHYYSLKDSLDPDHLPKYELVNDVVFIITRIYDKYAHPDADTIQELTTKLAIFVGKDFVITIHRPELDCLNAACTDAVKGDCPSIFEFLCNVLQQVLLTYEPRAMQLTDLLDKYEAKLFTKKKTPDLLHELYQLKRQAVVIQRMLTLSKNILDNIHSHINNKHSDEPMLQDVHDLHMRLDVMYDHVTDSANNLLNLYINLASQKTNEVVRILTVFSVFFMPLTFIVGVYGMNFKYMPELTMRYGYPAIMFLMGAITALIFIWFKRKKWL
jgi:magnesium transporter